MHQKKVIDSFKRRLEAISHGPAKRWRSEFSGQPLGNLLTEFIEFAERYFDYIAQTYANESEASLAQDLNTALNSLQQQWDVISRACVQRSIKEFGPQLAIADAQNQRYYDRFRGYKVPHAGPTTYFEKLYAIARYAYTPYPLISIPLYVFDDPTQWQALAHELGHYIYWNAASLAEYTSVQTTLRNAVVKALTDSVSTQLKSLSLSVSSRNFEYYQRRPQVIGICLNWLEEIFADVCGTLLAGPLYAHSAHRRLEETASTREQLIHDDLEHPSPYLRPLLTIETLKWVAGQLDGNDQERVSKERLERTIAGLEDEWKPLQAKCRRRDHRRSHLKMGVIADAIPVVVQVILGGGQNSDGTKSWVGSDGQPENLGQLIDYTAWLGDLPEVLTTLDEGGTPGLPSSLRGAVKPESIPEIPFDNRTAFQELLQYLETTCSGDEKQVRKALLSLELERCPLGRCETHLVRWVGQNNGNWALC